MNELHLVLKGRWYDMIEAGIKKEEYREIKPYFEKRLAKDYDVVVFHRGYTNRTIRLKYNGCAQGVGNKAWGAPDKEVFIIKLGERL